MKGNNVKFFATQKECLDFQDWFMRTHPWCEVVAGNTKKSGRHPEKGAWFCEWICNHGWYEKMNGRRVYY